MGYISDCIKLDQRMFKLLKGMKSVNDGLKLGMLFRDSDTDPMLVTQTD